MPFLEENPALFFAGCATVYVVLRGLEEIVGFLLDNGMPLLGWKGRKST